MGGATKLRLVDVLSTATRELVDALQADACGISRAVGDMLILVAEYAADGRSIQLGLGYLVSDYPATARVLADREPRLMTLADVDVDGAEASVLRELGFGSLLMLPLVFEGELWGLVEIYRSDERRFSDDDVRAARAVLGRLL